MSKPIFIIGAGRSGTSLLTWAIGQHPNIIAVPETTWLSGMLGYLDDFYRLGMVQKTGHFSEWGVTEEHFYQAMGDGLSGIVQKTFRNMLENAGEFERGEGLHWASAKDDPKQRWVDGTPAATGYASLLAQVFPECRFINLVRDPRKVITSYLTFEGRSLSDPIEAAEWIYNAQRAGYLAHTAFEDRCVRVFLDDLLANPEQEMRRIMSFVGEDFSPDCLSAFAGKVNPSGLSLDKGEADLAFSTLAAERMQEWYLLARADPDWRLIDPDAPAIDILDRLRKIRIPIPS